MKRGRPPDLATIPEGATWHQGSTAATARALRRAAERQNKKVRAGHRGTAGYVNSTGSKRELIVDLCCGTATSATLFHFLRSPHTLVLGVDRDCDEAWVREHLPASVQDRFVFVNADVKDINMSVLKKKLIEAWGSDARLCEITHLHWSPPCTSTSRASRGIGGHRYPDGVMGLLILFGNLRGNFPLVLKIDRGPRFATRRRTFPGIFS